jgi:hypothetical protein
VAERPYADGELVRTVSGVDYYALDDERLETRE